MTDSIKAERAELNTLMRSRKNLLYESSSSDEESDLDVDSISSTYKSSDKCPSNKSYVSRF